MLLTGMPSSAGEGYEMAMSVGALDTLRESTQLIMNYVQALPTDAPLLYMDPLNGISGFTTGGEVLFVNEESDRFVNENIYTFNMKLQSMAMKRNKENYAIFTHQMFINFAENHRIDKGAEILDKAAEKNEGDTLYEVDNIEGLAKSFDLAKENLLATIEHYNQLVQNGKDTDFDKDPEVLTAIEEGPFYIAQIDHKCFTMEQTRYCFLILKRLYYFHEEVFKLIRVMNEKRPALFKIKL